MTRVRPTEVTHNTSQPNVARTRQEKTTPRCAAVDTRSAGFADAGAVYVCHLQDTGTSSGRARGHTSSVAARWLLCKSRRRVLMLLLLVAGGECESLFSPSFLHKL